MRPSFRVLSIILSVFYIQSSFTADVLSETRSAIQEWVETEQLISLEKKQWQEEEASINDILSILAAEKSELEQQIAFAQEIASRADEERSLIVNQLSSYEEISDLLKTKVSDYERQILLISPYLPEILQKELAPRMARINSASQAVNFSLSERAQTVLNIMSEVERFDATLTLTAELINNSRNEPVEMRVLYFGLSRAFYVNRNASSAGYGSPTETGWQWQPTNDLSETIARSIDIFETRLSPQFILLPMKVEK